MLSHIQDIDLNQITLFPEAIDEYIPEDNPIRVLDAFVDSLDFKTLGFKHAVTQETGRSPHRPGDLLKHYVYGYLNRMRSSRMLEREARRNLEVMWLMRRLTPDFKTIADFRRDNLKAIQQVCREFTLFCRKLALFSGDPVAIDVSKFKAVNNRARNISKCKAKKAIKQLDAEIDRYLDEMDENDGQEPDEPRLSKEKLQEKAVLESISTAKYDGFRRQQLPWNA